MIDTCTGKNNKMENPLKDEKYVEPEGIRLLNEEIDAIMEMDDALVTPDSPVMITFNEKYKVYSGFASQHTVFMVVACFKVFPPIFKIRRRGGMKLILFSQRLEQFSVIKRLINI